MESVESHMKLALRCAAQARGFTSPNPPVGAVLVNDGRVVSMGSTQPVGALHAEIQAINAAGDSLRGAILYVSLEPCCHYGRTPPCTDAIISAGIEEVHIATKDPNPDVCSKGIKQLEEAGIKVHLGELKEEADEMIEAHAKFIIHKTPFITAKFAMTLDGKIATSSNDSKWISGEAARNHVHELRSYSDAILVGINTLLQDDPQLTSRLKDDYELNQQPIRVVVDSNLRIPIDAKIFSEPGKNLIATLEKSEKSQKIQNMYDNTEILLVPELNGRVNLTSLMQRLGGMDVTNVLVEGGSEIFGTLFDSNLIDKVLVFVAPKIIGGMNALSPVGGEGVDFVSDALLLKDISFEKCGEDLAITGYVVRR